MGISGAAGWLLRQRAKLPLPIARAVEAAGSSRLVGAAMMAATRTEIPAPMEVPQAATRMYIGPVNYAGQGYLWSRAVSRELPDVEARNLVVEVSGGLSFLADYQVPLAAYLGSKEWQRAHLESMAKFSHVVIEAGRANTGNLFNGSAGREARALLDRGVKVGWMLLGTDIRQPSRHMAAEEHSPFATDPRRRVLEYQTRRTIDLVRASGLPSFVTTPDLLLDLPEAIWTPILVDPERWRTAPPEFADGAPLRVLHSPSSRGVKGTELVLPQLRKLEAEGIITLDLVEGTPHAEIPARMAAANVVIEQFRIGNYGVAACEGMAAGRVVLGHISNQVRDAVGETGYELPIVEATPESIESLLREMHADPSRALEAAAAGPGFVDAVHTGKLSAEAFRPFLES